MEFKVGTKVKTKYYWFSSHVDAPDTVTGIVIRAVSSTWVKLEIERCDGSTYLWNVPIDSVIPNGPPKDASVLDIISYRLLAEEGIYVF